MKLLIGVDGSSGGFAAVRLGGRLLAAPHDQVAVYYTPPAIRHASGGDAHPEIIGRARQALADAVFDEARTCLPEPLRPTLHTIVGTKSPRQGLLLAADAWRADMLAVGARGSGPIAKLLLGSVARSVAHSATIPVLVVRPGSGAGEHPPRVLLACDGSMASRQAGDVLGKWTWPAGSTGRLIAVVESLYAGEVPQWLQQKARAADAEAMAQAWVAEHEAEKRAKETELAELCRRLPSLFQGSAPMVTEGHAAERILATVVSERIDLVVLGAKGRGMIERMLIGSTSDTVLSQAPCSVLLVREQPTP